jgi:hypothetical protein
MVFVANPVIGMADGIQRDLAVLLRQRNQFAPGVLFGRSTFVGVNVSIGAAQH